MPLEISREIQLSEWLAWKNRIEKLEQYNFIPVQYVNLLRKLFDSPEIIGYDSQKGQIRPGKNGQFDVYKRFKEFRKVIRMYLADLYPDDIRKENLKEIVRTCGLNPDDPHELAQFLLLFPVFPKETEEQEKQLMEFLANSLN